MSWKQRGGGKRVKKAPTWETSYKTLLEAGGFLCGSRSRRSGVPKFEERAQTVLTWLLQVIPATMTMTRLLSQVYSGKSRSSKLLIPQFGSLFSSGADIWNRMSTVGLGIKTEPLLHKNKNVSSLGWRRDSFREKKYLDANKNRWSSCVCSRMVQLSGVKNLPSAGSSQEPAEDAPTSLGHHRSLISTGPDRKRTGNVTKWPNFSLQGRRYTRQNHSCSPPAAKTLHKPTLHVKPPTRPHIPVLFIF